MRSKQVKNKRSIELQQLHDNNNYAEAMENKASVQQIAAQTSRDEFYFKLFAINAESNMAKKWFALKAEEAMEELTNKRAKKTSEKCSAHGLQKPPKRLKLDDESLPATVSSRPSSVDAPSSVDNKGEKDVSDDESCNSISSSFNANDDL